MTGFTAITVSGAISVDVGTAAEPRVEIAGDDNLVPLITTELLRSWTVPSYLRNDWYRDWGAIERYDRLIPASQAPNAVIDQGTITVRGWTRAGPIRALP